MPKRMIQPHSSLAAWRRAQGFTQVEAAAYLGLSQAFYSKLERHDQVGRKATLKMLTEATGVPLDILMGIAS